MSKHLQWFRFVPAVWLADPGLRLCSLSARGLWMDMLAIMYQATPVGTLRANGRAIDTAALAIMVASDRKTVEKALAELEKQRVFSRSKSGVIYSRRIKADLERLTNNRANGKLGGNPTLLKQRGNRKGVKAESESESESEGRALPRAFAHTRASQPVKSIDEEASELRAKLLREEAQGNG